MATSAAGTGWLGLALLLLLALTGPGAALAGYIECCSDGVLSVETAGVVHQRPKRASLVVWRGASLPRMPVSSNITLD
ncbi:UNVERIFIED_CONTAM: hypothetical protein K2H54_020613 [Gekko kuhli]